MIYEAEFYIRSDFSEVAFVDFLPYFLFVCLFLY